MSTPADVDLSVVVPAYRSAKTLPALVAGLAETLPTLAATYELIIVEDCAGDDTWAAVRGLAQAHPWVRGVTLARNAGQHAALLCGIVRSRGALIATMDDDLQHPPALLAELKAALTPDTDVVYGHPRRERHSWWRNLGSVLVKRALVLSTGWRDTDRTSALRLFRGHLREGFRHHRGGAVSVDVLLAWQTTRRAFVAVDFAERAHGRSSYTLRKLVMYAVELITGYTVWPLRLASALGLLATVFGIGILAFALVNWLVRTAPPPGFTFLASIIAIFSGAQLFCLGIIGEYLARMYRRSLELPTFSVREEVGGPVRDAAPPPPSPAPAA
jgi:undecaprenyl-phosphate 4-deoxy-4-formamido-L-arabinose transferase